MDSDQASRVTDVRKYVIKIVFLRKAEAVVIVLRHLRALGESPN